MQKIAIIGPASVGMALAEQMVHRNSDIQPFIIGVEDGFFIHEPTPKVVDDYRAGLSLSHSFEVDYKATESELAWLRKMAMQAETDKVVPLEVPVMKRVYYDNWPDKKAWQPKHQSQFTKSQASPKSRKAARKRAKAGRKATR
jgi:hypothetical protein